MRRIGALGVAAAMALSVAACGGDDGGEVRGVEGGGGSASGSGSGSASGSGSGSASGVTDPSSAGPTGALGGYTPVSDVTQHANVSLDLCAIDELLPEDGPIDFEAVGAVYTEGGSSVGGDGSPRTLAGFASEERDEAIWNDYAAHFADPTWLDTFVTHALEGTGPFEGEADAVRRQGVQKGVRNQIMIAWVVHELVAAAEKVAAGEIDPAEGAPHNWDEAWAFYHGVEPGCSPFGTADSRGENFGTGSAVNDAILAAMLEGLAATQAGDAAATQAAVDEVLRQVTITYVQASIRYAAVVAEDLAAGDTGAARVHQAEGWAFWRVIEPLVAAVDADAAATVTGAYDLASEPADRAAEVLAALESTYAGLGIDAAEVGTLQ